MSSHQPSNPAEPHLDASQQAPDISLLVAELRNTIKDMAARIKALESENEKLSFELAASRRRLRAIESEALCDVDDAVLLQPVLHSLFSGPSSTGPDEQSIALFVKFSEISPTAALVALGALDPFERAYDDVYLHSFTHTLTLFRPVLRKLDWIVSSDFIDRHVHLVSQIRVAIVKSGCLASNLHRLPSLRFVWTGGHFFDDPDPVQVFNGPMLEDLVHWRRHLKNLTSLSLQAMVDWSQDDGNELVQWTRLENLDLMILLRIDDSLLPPLAPLTRLQRLVLIDFSESPSLSLDSLAGVSSLTSLWLEYGLSNVDILRQLSSNKGLIELKLMQDVAFFPTKDIIKSWKLPNLEYLELGCINASNIHLVETVAQCLTSLKHLVLEAWDKVISTNASIFPPLKALSRLESLRLAIHDDHAGKSFVDSDTLCGLSNLQCLWLESFIATETILELPSLLPSLTFLDFSRIVLDKFEPAAKAFLKKTYFGRNDFKLVIRSMHLDGTG